MRKIAPAFFLLGLLTMGPSFLSFGAPPSDQERTSEELFLASPGYQALKEKKYDEALSEIDRLLTQHQNDPYLLRTKGILLIRSGKKIEGRELLNGVLKLNPLDRQARMYLAESYMEDQNKEEAEKQLRFVINNPDEPGYYEDKAQRALAVIEGKRVEKPTQEEKRWKIYGAYGMEYDDNVALRSSIDNFKVAGDPNAIRFNLRNGLSYDYLRDPSKRLGIAYTFSQSFHTDSLDEFNFRNHSVQHYSNYFTEVAGKPATLGLKYTFDHATLKDETFSSSNSFLPWFSIEPVDNLVLSLYNNISAINFRNKGFNEGVSSRDGLYNTAGVMSTFYFSQRRRFFSLGYEFGYNETEGDNFDARIHAGKAVLHTPLIEKISIEGFFSVVDDQHFNYAYYIHRHDIHLSAGAKLIRPITQHIEMRVYYYFTKVNNTDDEVLGQFEYSRHIVGGEISFSY